MKLRLHWQEIPASKRYGKVYRLCSVGTQVRSVSLADFDENSRQFHIRGGVYRHTEFFPEQVQTDEAKKAYIQGIFGVEE